MKILDARPGVVEWFHKDESEGTFTIQTVQDVNPVLENNKALQTLNDGYSPSRELKRVASIPTTLARKWCKEAGISFRRFMRRPHEYAKWLERKLKDPDNRFLLTAPWFSHKYTRPQPSGIIGLDEVVKAGRAIKPLSRFHTLRHRVADWIFGARHWAKRLDDWLFDLQARVRG